MKLRRGVAMAGLTVLASMAGVPPAAAPSPAAARKGRFSLGAGVLLAPRPYVGVDDETIAIPLVLYDRGGFYVRGLEAGYTWRKESPVSATVFGQAFFNGYESDDSPFLAGMEDREPSFDGGIGLDIDRKRVAVVLRASTDLTHRSDGHRGRLDVRFPCAAGPWRLTPAIGAEYLSDDVVDYYYGVRPAEATGARPVHAGDAALNVVGSLRAIRSAGGRWSFFGYAELTRLGSAIEESPIVDEGTDLGALAGFLYTFQTAPPVPRGRAAGRLRSVTPPGSR